LDRGREAPGQQEATMMNEPWQAREKQTVIKWHRKMRQAAELMTD
jgi:hypothetical protein